ncbi:MAG: HAD family phosphatase [Devosiaceae bacterium]|nr:HAD family phosphatase [Devosiaceae bacterium]
MPFNPDDLQAVIFDMDGVLVDTEVVYKTTAFEVAKEQGFHLSDELHNSTIGLPTEVGGLIIREAMGPEFAFDEFMQVLDARVAARLMAQVPVKRGVIEILNTLEELQIPVAVVTSSSSEAANHHLSRSDLIASFEIIITRDDVDNGKPHPEPYLLAAERLEVEPKFCLAIEDSYNGVRSAHGAGMLTIMVPDILAPTDEMHSLSIAVMKDMHQVKSHFE